MLDLQFGELIEAKREGREACGNLNGVIGERAWNHRKWHGKVQGFKI